MSDWDSTALRDHIVDNISRRPSGRWSIKLRTLMELFGYTAQQRVRQSSLVTVETTLADWGIGCSYRSSAPDDRVTLFLQDAAPPVSTLSDSADPPIEAELAVPSAEALAGLFYIGDTRDDGRSQGNLTDMLAALWACRPVCVIIEAADEQFAFACGLLAMLMRRRALMVRSTVMGTWLPAAPELLTIGRLHALLGGARDDGLAGSFPASGGVYLLREDPQDIEDDELVATVRECFVPHTYRFTARMGTPEQSREQLLRWVAALAGSLQVALPEATQTVDLASLLAEAIQLHDALLAHQAQHVDPAFRAGFESSEHMALKSALLHHLRRLAPSETIAVEELRAQREFDDVGGDMADRTRSDKPDLRLGSRIWVEVETLRGLALSGSNPFLALESKLRPKLAGMKSSQAVWLIVPGDVALLAADQLHAVVRNLNAALGAEIIRVGFVDLLTQAPVFLRPTTPPVREARLVGASWRRRQHVPPTQPLTWDDVAGYSDVKTQITDDLLAPLQYEKHYRSLGLPPANGLLLYGLPGCGKSYIGRVLASVVGLPHRLVLPSDLSSMWLHESVTKTRELFDWALKQAPCLLILDELDAVAPQRREDNMHSDEKRQVNELLTQFDRIAGSGVVVVATTNYARGIDAAIQRSGRFDVKLPIFPPGTGDREAIFRYYVKPLGERGFEGVDGIDYGALASRATLFTPADIRTAVHTAARQQARPDQGAAPTLSTDILIQAIGRHPRSIRRDMADSWVLEVAGEFGGAHPQLQWLREEITRAYGSPDTPNDF